MEQEPINVFISIGNNEINKQDVFRENIFKILREYNLKPIALGITEYQADYSLTGLKKTIQNCYGAVIIALERIYFSKGIEKRNSPKALDLKNQIIPTVWNQIEATLAFSLDMPILVITEEGARQEGLIDKKFVDWTVLTVPLEENVTDTKDLRGNINQFAEKAQEFKLKTDQIKAKDLEQKNELERVQKEFERVNGELKKEKEYNNKIENQNKVESLKQQLKLENSKNELEKTKGELKETKGELEKTKNKLVTTMEELEKKQNELISIKTRPNIIFSIWKKIVFVCKKIIIFFKGQEWWISTIGSIITIFGAIVAIKSCTMKTIPNTSKEETASVENEQEMKPSIQQSRKQAPPIPKPIEQQNE